MKLLCDEYGVCFFYILGLAIQIQETPSIRQPLSPKHVR
jgi:hypothetical protein